MEYLLSILLALFLTLIVETPLYFFLLKIKRKSSLLTLILMNVFTNVLMNLTYLFLIRSSIFIYVFEIIIPFIEGSFLFLYIDKLDINSSSLKIKNKGIILFFYTLLIAFISNLLSYFLGELFNNYLYPLFYNYYLVLIYSLIFILEILKMIIYLLKKT